jgi:hypothetical protein
MKSLLLILLYLFTSFSFADNLDNYISTCKDLGFKQGTEKLGDCVLELKRRDGGYAAPSAKRQNQSSSTNQQSNQQQYEMQANEYFQQQQALYDQQMALYQRQKSDYETQQIALQKEKEKQRWLKLSEFGFRLGAGQSATDAAMATAGMQPLPRPIPPNMQLDQYYRITTPNGGSVNCRYDPKIRTATCY